MRVDVVTIFPGMFDAILGESMMKRAQENGHLSLGLWDLRDYTHDSHRSVDDRPYGGGPGMVMKPQPLFDAVEDIKQKTSEGPSGQLKSQTILLSPQGEKLTTSLAQELAVQEQLIMVCGHYEGVDERVRTELIDRSVSIGDYVLTGGELPAMVLIDALMRYVPGVLGHEKATEEESFAQGMLEYPHYTRPQDFKGMQVPQVLLSGDHEEIARWRKEQAYLRTKKLRPDLLS